MRRSIAQQRAAALVIVLAFVVLLTGLVVAYFSVVSADRTLSSGSSRQEEADQCARAALNVITGDLKHELTAALPVTSANIEPRRTEYSGSGADAMPNLIRRSRSSDASSRASAVNSTTDPSLNGRFVTAARWNKHYLIPRASGATETDTTPDSAVGFVSPDWVYVTAIGPRVLNSPDATTSGRYAYAIYDEGGLVDVNVAGYPFALALADAGSKGPMGLSDLTVAGIANANTGTKQVDRIIGWRNYATTQATADTSSTFPKFDSTPTSAGLYRDYVLSATRPFTTVNPVTAGGNRTDQVFASRQQLLAFRSKARFAADAMQYLATFSRGRNRQSWSDSATRLHGRFPLSRFDLFANPGANAAQLKAQFGLEYIAASGPQPEHWRYIGAAGSAGVPISSVPLLVGNGQDPDLPVLLKYALPTASTADILGMIASMIDLRDANSDTTWIEYSNGGTPPLPLKAFGADATPSTEPGAPPSSATVNDFKRAFRNAGELGYALKDGTATSVNFASSGGDSPLLDLFTLNTAPIRGGLINLNTHNSVALACMFGRAYKLAAKWNTGTTSDYTTVTNAKTIAAAIVTASTASPATSRADIGRLAMAPPSLSTEDAREVVARALSESTQAHTWNVMIDVIAQSGRYPTTATTATDLPKFTVQGEKRYWLHIALDRLTGDVIDQQLEPVYE